MMRLLRAINNLQRMRTELEDESDKDDDEEDEECEEEDDDEEEDEEKDEEDDEEKDDEKENQKVRKEEISGGWKEGKEEGQFISRKTHTTLNLRLQKSLPLPL